MQRVIDYNIKDNYRDSKNKAKIDNPELYKYLKDLGYKEYKKRIKVLNEQCIEEVLNNPFGIKFPMGIGELSIKKRKNRFVEKALKVSKTDALNIKSKYWYLINESTDWKLTKDSKSNFRVLYTNDHSDGYKFYWIWNKAKDRLKHSELYYLAIERKWNRTLAKRIFEGKQNYLVFYPRKYKIIQ